ncbi:MAG: HlyC/CorC family transporter [Chloroflexi bacterium]|nr:HlyC/CorC family transporter [Chloroflexota bacterium]
MDTAAAWPPIVLTILLLAVNAFFVAAEFALLRVRPTQFEELVPGSVRARVVDRQVRRIDWYLSACQVGITGASLALGWVGGPAIAEAIRPLFAWLEPLSAPVSQAAGFVVAFALITFVHIVLAEQAPKYLAIKKALPIALANGYPLELFYRLVFPYIWLVSTSANRILAFAGISPTGDRVTHTGEELKLLVDDAADSGGLQESEREIVGNALSFADTLVRQVMIPRTEMAAVAEDAPKATILALARQHPYSRYPVFHESLDGVVGVVHLRDLLTHDGEATARDLMRPVPLLPETMHLDAALAELRRRRASLAIVLDEFGGTAGLVTLENILERIVGEVHDEFETDEQARIRADGPGRFLVNGLTPLEELRAELGMPVPVQEGDEPETVGGLVFGRLGRLPTVGDRVELDGWLLEVTVLDGFRIAQVRAQRWSAAPGAR